MATRKGAKTGSNNAIITMIVPNSVPLVAQSQPIILVKTLTGDSFGNLIGASSCGYLVKIDYFTA